MPMGSTDAAQTPTAPPGAVSLHRGETGGDASARGQGAESKQVPYQVPGEMPLDKTDEELLAEFRQRKAQQAGTDRERTRNERDFEEAEDGDEQDEDDDPDEADAGSDEDADGDEDDGAPARDKQRGEDDEPTSNRLKNALRTLRRAGVDEDVTRGMTNRAALEAARAIKKVMSENDDLRRRQREMENRKQRGELEDDSGDSRREPPSHEADSDVREFDRFDGDTKEAMKRYDTRVKSHVKQTVTPIVQGLKGLHAIQQEQGVEIARQGLAVRYSQLNSPKVASKFERRVGRYLATGDYDESPTATARIRAAAYDAARDMFRSKSKNGTGAPHAMRNGGPTTRSKDSSGRKSDPLARRFEAFQAMRRGTPPGQARQLAGVDDE